MTKASPLIIILSSMFLVTMGYFLRERAQEPVVTPIPVLSVIPSPAPTATSTNAYPCHSYLGKPDPNCTPGAVFPALTAHDVCKPGYTASVRDVSIATKRLVYARYGLSYPQP